MNKESRLFSKSVHGNIPIIIAGTIKQPEYTLEYPDRLVTLFTRRDVMKTLVGYDESWPRYFKLGKYQTRAERESENKVTVADMFAPELKSNDRITTVAGEVKVGPVLGIDLAKRGHEVKKLLFAGFGQKIHNAGYDPDDVLQEVYKGILVRNNGKCPFDVRKASFGHYVHMVCDCIVSNYHRRMVRQRKVEPLADDADELLIDQTDSGIYTESDDAAAEDFLSTLTVNQALVRKVLPYVRAGFGRSEIAEKMGLPKTLVSKALSDLREEARAWAQ